MTRSAKVSVFSFLLLSALGCASGPKYEEVASRLPAFSPDKGRIYFYRVGSMFGSGVRAAVKLNGEKVGDSVSGGFYFVDRPPGNYEVSTATEAEYKAIFTLSKGETKYVRTHISMGFFAGHVIPNLVDPSDGLVGIRACSYIGDEAQLIPAVAPASAPKT